MPSSENLLPLSRRALLVGALGLAGVQGAKAFAVSVRQRLVPVRGTRLYVEESGPANAPALVYLHGGPGVGSYEFSYYARALLSTRWRVVTFDQRGVLRSDPIGEHEKFGMDDLVADIDALREALGVERWSLFGHSFGGHYALRYGLAHPERVEIMFLENPAYSFPEATRSTLRATAALYRSLGKTDLAAKATALVSSNMAPRDLLNATGQAMAGLGEERQRLYLYDQRWRGFFGRLQKRSGLTDSRWNQGQVQAAKLFEDGKILEPMLDRIAGWRGPTILLKGESDHACSPEEAAAVAALHEGQVVHIPRAGHFIHVEQPALLARSTVTAQSQFIRRPRGGTIGGPAPQGG